MAHNRKIILGGVSLTKARCNRYDLEVMEDVDEELEKILIEKNFFEGMPFSWIGLILRYGLKNEDEPHYQRIDKKDGELPLAIELDTHEIRDASRDELKRLFMIACLKSIIHVAKKYKLPVSKFEVFENKLNEFLTG